MRVTLPEPQTPHARRDPKAPRAELSSRPPSASRWRRLGAWLVAGLMAWSCQSSNSGLEPGDNPSGGDGGPPGTSVEGGAVPPAPSDWCSARKVLEGHCTGCHVVGSPFGSIPLVTIDDLEAQLPSGLRAYQSVGRRIHDPGAGLMPPTSDRLSPIEMATLDNWIAAGAPRGSNPSCIPGADDGGGGAGGSSGAGGSGGTAGTGQGGGGAGGSGGTADGGVDVRVDAADGSDVKDGGAADAADGADAGSKDAGTDGDGGPQPPTGWPTDCEDRYTVVAHGVSQPGDKTKFNVSGAVSKDFYQCFLFKAPWGASTVQGLRFRPVIDDARVVARWTLYGLDSSSGPDGQITAGACSNGTYLQGWAPGSTETALPADVGMRMPKGASSYLALEVHYDNTANVPSAADASGVEFCVTKTLRKNTASVHWLGTTNFNIAAYSQTDVANTCDPTATQPIHIVAIHPQMNRLGAKARLVLNRPGAAAETLHEGKFSIADQQTYSSTAIVNDGDTLTTTCSYNNNSSRAVGFGNAMTDENCYNFVTAYPAGTLSGFLSTDRCIGLF